MKKIALFYGLLISSNLTTLYGAPDKPQHTIVFENGDKCIEEFFDLGSKHSNQDLFWWLKQMILLAKKEGNTSLDPVFAKLGQACVVKPNEAKIDRAPRIAQIFIDYKAYFSKELFNQIKKIGFPKVLTILKKRAQI